MSLRRFFLRTVIKLKDFRAVEIKTNVFIETKTGTDEFIKMKLYNITRNKVLANCILS